ncbi:MAG: B12-binding domain-containing radical SAM protein [Nitrospinae bacterium]|nr:B12-binding domain-containing radical SAM protein [Nitrospinota bacterium]
MKVLLATLHSKFIHSSLALPCIAATCSGLKGVDISIKEFTTKEPLDRLIVDILDEGPDIIGFSCYIWNIEKTLLLASGIKRVRPGILVVLGGPEVSYDAGNILKTNNAVDCIVKGEGEGVFRDFLDSVNMAGVAGLSHPGLRKAPGISYRTGGGIFDNGTAPAMPDLDLIPSPFSLGLVETGKPLVYYESSRGCPFTCAFCLSALDGQVRSFSMERIREDLSTLINAGAKQVKFVDRTFNYHAGRANAIWAFILEQNIARRGRDSRFHFEIAADLLTDENIETLKKVQPGVFRFEIGVQSIAEETLASVSRKSDASRLFSNVKRLVEETFVHIHLDLVAGLPGEDFSGFLASLQRLFSANPHHIQVEPLKVLKGSPMMDIAKKEGYTFSGVPPYRIITTPWLSEEEVERIETIGRLLELVYNKGRFKNTLHIIRERTPLSEFFDGLSRYWRSAEIQTLSLDDLFETFWTFAKGVLSAESLPIFAGALSHDRCLADYPVAKGLPSYMARDLNDCRVTRSEIRKIRKKFDIAPHIQVKAFRYRFESCYGVDGGRDRLFIYLSGEGRKLEVIAMPVLAE